MNKHDKDMPNRQSNMEKAEGSRESVLSDTESFERGTGKGSERAREQSGMERDRGSDAQERDEASGISNRGIGREQEEQRHLPERGSSRSES